MWIENRQSYRIRRLICVMFGIFSALFLTAAIIDRQDVLAAREIVSAQEKLADEVFRFHVLANSDSEADQQLKLKVRDCVLSYMEEELMAGEEYLTEAMRNSQRVKVWAAEHLDEIEQTASAVIAEAGYDYPVSAKVVECYFPDRRYGDVLFPKGYYEALRVEIGEAKGQNWWCVLYPSLCFTDVTCAVVTNEGEEELEKVLDPETYETVTGDSTFKIKSFFLEFFREKWEH